MDTLHLVDPELRPFLDVFPTHAITADNLADVRGRTLPLGDDDDHGVTLETVTVTGPVGAPDIDLLVLRPKGATGPLPCIYHMHGGGFVIGSAKEFAPLIRPLAAELECVIVSVDYRLSPETVFPGAIEDCYAGLAWTFANADKLGVDPARIGVMGESAGGGYAAALALLARDRGDYRLAFQHLIYPMIDDRTCVAEPTNPVAGEFIWHAKNNHFGWTALLGREPGGQDVSAYAAAARADSVLDLPPTFISAGALDLFVDEDIAYATRLMRAGVPTELHVYPGAFHAFDMMPGAHIAEKARRDSRAALARFVAVNPV